MPQCAHVCWSAGSHKVVSNWADGHIPIRRIRGTLSLLDFVSNQAIQSIVSERDKF